MARADETDDLERSPSEWLGFYLLSAWIGFRKGIGRGKEYAGSARRTFWRELLATLVLLVVWQVVAFTIPFPLVRWSALREFGQLWWLNSSRMSVGALGLGPYLLAHGVMFCVVMAVSRIRRMGLCYRVSLNRHLLGLTFVFSLVQGWSHLAWLSDLVSPSGRLLLMPYWSTHPMMYRAVGLSVLLGGVAFSLVVIGLIQRYGLPCAFTCMMLWTGLMQLSLLKAPWQAFREAVANNGVGAPHQAAWWFRLVAFLLAAIFLAGVATAILLLHLKANSWWKNLTVRLRTSLLKEPSPYLFSTWSTGLLMACVTLVPENLLMLRVVAGTSPEVLQRYLSWCGQHSILIWLLRLALILPSAFLTYRLFYNPALRQRLGANLGLSEPLALLRQSAFRSLFIWCGFVLAVTAVSWLIQALVLLGREWWPLGLIEIWDIVLLLLTIHLLRNFYRSRQEGPCLPVLTHGYYEPLYAAQALLQSQGIRCQIWGEPYAFLTGVIVGPIAMKHLLVAEVNSSRASALLSPGIETATRRDEDLQHTAEVSTA